MCFSVEWIDGYGFVCVFCGDNSLCCSRALYEDSCVCQREKESSVPGHPSHTHCLQRESAEASHNSPQIMYHFFISGGRFVMSQLCGVMCVCVCVWLQCVGGGEEAQGSKEEAGYLNKRLWAPQKLHHECVQTLCQDQGFC